MKELSIIIPSLRPQELAGCIKSIQNFTEDIDFEIIVISPFSPFDFGFDKRIVWVKRDQRDGVVAAVNAGYPHATGIWITTLSDEVRVMHGWAKNMIDFLKDQKSLDVMGNFRVVEHGEHPQFLYYGMLFSIFPFLRKSLADKIGGLFDPAFGAFYADPDLGMRVWAACGKVVTCPNAFVFHPYRRDEINERSRLNHEEKDKETFIKRWGYLEEPNRPFYAEEIFV